MRGGSLSSPLPPPLGYTPVLCTFYLTIHCVHTSKQTHESQKSLPVSTSCNQSRMFSSHIVPCLMYLCLCFSSARILILLHFCCLIVFFWCLFHTINVLMSLFKISFYLRQHAMHLLPVQRGGAATAPKPNFSMFYALSQNYQQCFEK